MNESCTNSKSIFKFPASKTPNFQPREENSLSEGLVDSIENRSHGAKMFNSISRGVLRKSRRDARIELRPSSLQGGESTQLSPEVRIISRSEAHVELAPKQPNLGSVDSPGAPFDREKDFPSKKSHGNSADFQGPKILSVGGGKGGIGKSFISTNLAVCLAHLGYKVSLVDLDLGAANLHTCLGVPHPKKGLFDFVSSESMELSDIAIDTQVPGLNLFAGGQEFWQQIRPHSSQKVRLISRLQQLMADYVILDLGAGTHVNTLDFFIFSHAGLLIVVPEPTSIENAYVFLKSILFRKLQSIIRAIREEEACEELLRGLANPKNPKPPFAQLEEFASKNAIVGNRIIQLIRLTQMGIVMNQVRTGNDRDIGHSMAKICQRYFGFNAQLLGVTHYDDEAWRSVRNRKPVCIERPGTASARDIQSLADRVCGDVLPLFPGSQSSAAS